MSRFSFSGQPFLLGFEHVERMAERAAKAGADSYPPYNIERIGARAYRITLAVAGFAENELEITVEDASLLIVRGRAAQDGAQDLEFLHRGIAARQFQKSFVLAEGVEAHGARLRNGLLHIDLARRDVEDAVRHISISSA